MDQSNNMPIKTGINPSEETMKKIIDEHNSAVADLGPPVIEQKIDSAIKATKEHGGKAAFAALAGVGSVAGMGIADVAPAGANSPVSTHVFTVQAGDTLSGIASNSGVSLGDVEAANPMHDFDAITTGQQIEIPGASNASGNTATTTSEVTVQAGDTLSGIASNSGVSLGDVEAANPMHDFDAITTGQQIEIPGNSTGYTPAPAPEVAPAIEQTPVAPSTPEIAPATINQSPEKMASIGDQYNYLISKYGLSPGGAAGVLGNARAESNNQPERLQGSTDGTVTPAESLTQAQIHDSNVGWGEFQFTPSSKLIDPSRAEGKNPNDPLVQIDFVIGQINGSYLLTQLKNPDISPEDAAAIFEKLYERPATLADAPVREKFARGFFDQFSQNNTIPAQADTTVRPSGQSSEPTGIPR